MVAIALHLPPILRPTRIPNPPLSSSARSLRFPFPPTRRPLPCLAACRRRGARAAYVSAPASFPDAVDKEPEAASDSPTQSPPLPISWGVLLPLLARDKMRIALSLVSLVGCTSCTLAMPIYSGKFFEILIGRRSEPLWNLLSKIAVLYSLEPIFTVVFVTNMATVWEKVMASLRGQVFRRMLIQKVEFFDRFKVGELTGLLTSDLGSLKDVVSDNISRDRGLRALSEASNFLLLTM